MHTNYRLKQDSWAFFNLVLITVNGNLIVLRTDLYKNKM